MLTRWVHHYHLAHEDLDFLEHNIQVLSVSLKHHSHEPGYVVWFLIPVLFFSLELSSLQFIHGLNYHRRPQAGHKDDGNESTIKMDNKPKLKPGKIIQKWILCVYICWLIYFKILIVSHFLFYPLFWNIIRGSPC